jgi:uncharacterized membrane protein YraQ (UPF0718 family)
MTTPLRLLLSNKVIFEQGLKKNKRSLIISAMLGRVSTYTLADKKGNPFIRFIKNVGRNIKATGVYFLVGIALAAIFQRYVPADTFASLFGGGNRGFGLLMAATVGVPLYLCGGGTIPLLMAWLDSGMSAGSATAFMITGPATKITNLGAVKIVLGYRHFVFYLAFVMLFALLSGFIADCLL